MRLMVAVSLALFFSGRQRTGILIYPWPTVCRDSHVVAIFTVLGQVKGHIGTAVT